jgi:DNA-binding MarR family transcriptional regulator
MGSAKGERSEDAAKQASGQAKGRRAADSGLEGESLAQEAWALLFELMRHAGRHFPAIAAEFELSPVQVHVLRTLGEAPQPMSSLAGFLGCDASNVTGLVDRLEARGLVRRAAAPEDRRAYRVRLTAAGRKLWKAILPHYYRTAEQVWGAIPAARARQLVAELGELSGNAERVVQINPKDE